MSAWTARELDRIDTAEELQLTARRADGSARQPVTIWVVRVDDGLYVRSWRGKQAAWYRAIDHDAHAHITAGGIAKEVRITPAGGELSDQIDAAYRTKYARYPSYVEPMLGAQARAATFALIPEQVSS